MDYYKNLCNNGEFLDSDVIIDFNNLICGD